MDLKELVAIPISLELEIVIDGIKFYSSENLKNKFVLAFAKSSKGKHITKEIESLVKAKLVLPCYKSKNLLGFLKRKLTGSPNKYILGFYHVDEKKVVILIENSATIFGTSSNNELVSTTMHECMHLIAARNLNKFTSIFEPYLKKYYQAFFEDYLQINNFQKNSINYFISYVKNLERLHPAYADKHLVDYYRLLVSLFKESSNLNDQDFEERLTDYVVAIKLLVRYLPALIKSRKYVMLFRSLNRAYFNTFGETNKYTTPIQELISLSEVACVLAEMKPQEPVIKKLFDSIV